MFKPLVMHKAAQLALAVLVGEPVAFGAVGIPMNAMNVGFSNRSLYQAQLASVRSRAEDAPVERLAAPSRQAFPLLTASVRSEFLLQEKGERSLLDLTK